MTTLSRIDASFLDNIPEYQADADALSAGYVEQVDTLLPELTVSEMLMYTAELKRPESESLKV